MIAFDCRPGAIAVSLALRKPKYQETAAYCHFGLEAVTRNGMKLFEWEIAKDLSKYKTMSSTQVEAELKSSNYLTRWVDCCCTVTTAVACSVSSGLPVRLEA